MAELILEHALPQVVELDVAGLVPDEVQGECKIVCVKGLYKSTSVLAY